MKKFLSIILLLISSNLFVHLCYAADYAQKFPTGTPLEVVTPSTGDSDYVRLDNSNQASWTPTSILVPNLNADLLDGISSSSFSQLGAFIDDTELTAEDFGDFTATGLEDGVTIDADSIALGTDTTGNYATSNAEGGNALDLTCTDCIGTTEIEDVYVLNTGDQVDGNLNINNTSATSFIVENDSGTDTLTVDSNNQRVDINLGWTGGSNASLAVHNNRNNPANDIFAVYASSLVTGTGKGSVALNFDAANQGSFTSGAGTAYISTGIVGTGSFTGSYSASSLTGEIIGADLQTSIDASATHTAGTINIFGVKIRSNDDKEGAGTSNNYGVSAVITGGDTAFGIYAKASGATTNYPGYFTDGTDTVIIQSGTNSQIDVSDGTITTSYSATQGTLVPTDYPAFSAAVDPDAKLKFSGTGGGQYEFYDRTAGLIWALDAQTTDAGHLTMSNDSATSTNFYKLITLDNGPTPSINITIWIANNASPNATLTGGQGDICFSTNGNAYRNTDGAQAWSAM